MRNQCTCTDCALDQSMIEKVESGANIKECGGDEECQMWYHEEGELCDTSYECDNCGELHDEEVEAEECCTGWMCNYCGYTHTPGGWLSAREQAAQCCVSSCDDCGATGWPDYLAVHSCDSGMGMRRQLPWEARGILVDARNHEQWADWKSVWGINPEEHHVVRAAADYYLLEAIEAGLVGTTNGEGDVRRDIADSDFMRVIRREAGEMMADLVQVWDPILMSYTHMAVGGELRHHQSVGGEVLPDQNRDAAWSGWKLIFEAVGPDALTDAAELFREFTGGSFGGNPWAEAAEILHARITGKISPRLFLDRIFNAQHNGGCLLNKVSWKGDKLKYGDKDGQGVSLSELTYNVLPAHGAEPEPDYRTLLAYASEDVRRLFNDSYAYAGKAAYSIGAALHFRPARPRKGLTKTQQYKLDQAKEAAKLEAYYALPQSKKYEQKAKDAETNMQYFAKYVESEKNKNAAILAKGPAAPCKCGVEGCTAIPGYDTYYQDMQDHWAKEVEKYITLMHEAYADEMKAKPKVKAKKAKVATIPWDTSW